MKGRSKNSLYAGKQLQGEYTESCLIFKALTSSKRPLTRREISEQTGLEIATLCRALFNLVYKRNNLIISYYKLCKTTGKTVMHFAIKKKKEGVKW